MDMMVMGMLIGGLVLLVVGGELLVRGASHLAAIVGVSPLVIGLTVVAYGTSTPELAVSVQAGMAGNANIAVANVVGSNIFNVLFILGLCAVILPLTVTQQLVRLDVPIMIGASLLSLAMAWDSRIVFAEGVILFALVVIYTIWAIRKSRQESAAVQAEYAQEYAVEEKQHSWMDIAKQVGFVLVGLVILVIGSRWLIDGSIILAKVLGVSDVVIGLTIVAAGTSLPEVATSIIATLRGERDIAIGNVIGSNIYNLLAILGLSSMVTPGGLAVAPSIINFDMLVMVAVAIACLPIFFSGYQIARWEGILFFLSYVAYTLYLILDATQHDALPLYSNTMFYFVLPLIGITVIALGLRALHTNGRTVAISDAR
jgi:cation:H+ antiporter